MKIADSDVLIDALRGRDPWRTRIGLEIQSGALSTTTINLFELMSGADTKKEASKVEDLLGGLRILSLDETAAREAAAIRRELQARGLPIATADTLIAGICRSIGATLLTRNRSHFQRVDGLAIDPL